MKEQNKILPISKTEMGKVQKFIDGDIVESDTLIEQMIIVDSWWSDNTYGSKTGDFVYRLRFLTKSGKIDERRNSRQFEESRLTLISKSKLV